jgi:hypothetical protein
MDPNCGKLFFSPVRQMWVGMARNKKETFKVRLLGASKKREEIEKVPIDEAIETREVKKILSPTEQFCLHCRLKHQREAQAVRNRDKNIGRMRARQLGQSEDEVPIRTISEDEAKAFDRYTVQRKVAMDYRQTQMDAQKAEVKTSPEAVQAALKKLEEIKKDKESPKEENKA